MRKLLLAGAVVSALIVASGAAHFYVPPQTFNQNGLNALLTGNSNYDNYVSPMLATANPFGTGEMTLRLFGVQGAAIPEPASIAILGFGLLGLGLLRRYRRS
jgi:hypothetical protein